MAKLFLRLWQWWTLRRIQRHHAWRKRGRVVYLGEPHPSTQRISPWQQ